MHYDAVGAFLIVISNIFFWYLALRQKKKSSLAYAFFGWSLFITLWAFGYGITLAGFFDRHVTLIWNKYCQAMATLIGPFFFRFASHAIYKYEKYKKIFYAYFIFGVINAVGLFFTDFYVKGLWSFGNYIYQPLGGPLYVLFAGFFAWCTCHAFLIVISNFQGVYGLQRKQLVLWLWATGIAYFGGGTLFLQGFQIPFPSTGVYLILGYVIIIGYSVLRYQYMEIELLVKRTVVFAGLLLMVMSVIAVVMGISQSFLGEYFRLGTTASMVISGFIIIIVYEPTRKLLLHITDRYLFQKKEDIRVVLNRLAERVVTILDFEQIGRTILSTLGETFRLESGMIFIHDKQADRYRLLDYFGSNSNEFASSVRCYFEQPGIADCFSKCGSFFNIERLDQPENVTDIVREWLIMAKARVCIPLFVDGDRKGLLVLGKKKSDDEFTREETDFFPIIASQAALALRNAFLFETVLQEREAKIKAEHVAERVWFAATIKHEVKNRLGPDIEGPIKLFQLHYARDLKKAFDEGDKKWFDETFSIIERMAEQVLNGSQAILDISDTTLGGIEADRSKFQRNYFKILWNEAKRASGLEKLCDFESNFPDRFVIYGNYHILVRVFENLIINAYDAMKDREEKLIKLRASYKDFEGQKVTYFEFEDHGTGIPGNICDKIFERGFSTKPKPPDEDLVSSGHGQGLYVCRTHIEKIHHGKIWVESEHGNGAVFKFWIPIESSQRT